MEPRPALSVVGGGLGAGKTTLVARLLRRPDMAGTAVVVNEFGEIGIDDLVLGAAEGRPRIALLRNGCLCCAPGNDLSQAVLDLLEASGTPLRRILVETSGAAALSAVIARIAEDHRLRRAVRLDAAVAVIDATAPDPLGPEAAAEHILCADRLVVSKADLAPPGQVAALRAGLARLAPETPQFLSSEDPGPDRLLDAGLVDPATGEARPDRWLRAGQGIFAHAAPVRSWLLEAGPMDWALATRLVAGLQRAAGPDLLRLKGLVAAPGDPRPYVLQVVRDQVFRPVRLPPGTGDGRTRLVVIARAGAATAVEDLRRRLPPEPVA